MIAATPLRILSTGAFLALAASAQVQQHPPRQAAGVQVRPPVLLASGYDSAAVHRFDPISGEPLGRLANIPGAHSVTLGPDQLLYICAEEVDAVLRFDPNTGAHVDDFIVDDPLTPLDETGGLNGPTSAIFGRDDHLLVASFNNDRVLKYDGATGAFLGVFVSSASSTLNGPDAGMTFGPGGRLYVPSFYNDRILQFDGQTGASLGAFISAGSGGLSRPRDIEFHRDGLVYVSSSGSDEILRYKYDGSFVDVFASTNDPTGMAFGPHDGLLYVTSYAKSYIKSYDVRTGTQVSKPVGNNSGILEGGVFLHFLRYR